MAARTFLVCLLFASIAHAGARDGDVQAVTDMGVELSSWFAAIPEKPKTIAVFSVALSDNLDANFAGIVESIIIAKLNAQGVRVSACYPCRAPRVEVKGEQIIVTKGIPDHQAMVDLASTMEVESFLTVKVTKTKFSILTHVTLVQVPSGTVISTGTFSIPSIDLSETSLLLMFSAGFHYQLSGKRRSGNPPTSIDIGILEQVGSSTKAGLDLGVMIAPGQKALIYATPELAWKIAVRTLSIVPMPSLRFGIGAVGSSVSFVGGFDFDVFLGRIFYLGAGTLSAVPFDGTRTMHFVGGHLGAAMGR